MMYSVKRGTVRDTARDRERESGRVSIEDDDHDHKGDEDNNVVVMKMLW